MGGRGAFGPNSSERWGRGEQRRRKRCADVVIGGEAAVESGDAELARWASQHLNVEKLFVKWAINCVNTKSLLEN